MKQHPTGVIHIFISEVPGIEKKSLIFNFRFSGNHEIDEIQFLFPP